MTRAERVAVSVERAVKEEGFVFLCEGTGCCNDVFYKLKDEGVYDVRSWYTNYSGGEDAWTWVIYGKLKTRNRRDSSKEESVPTIVTIDYASMSVKALRECCKLSGIKGYGKMRKDDMIKSLQSL